MSTDLELVLPLIKTKIPCDDNNNKINISINRNCVISGEGEVEVEEEECRTPKSPRNMIPPIMSCPPAPRKPAPARRQSSCKRKMCDELRFFEIVARDEIESFFRVAEKNINGAKRRCVI